MATFAGRNKISRTDKRNNRRDPAGLSFEVGHSGVTSRNRKAALFAPAAIAALGVSLTLAAPRPVWADTTGNVGGLYDVYGVFVDAGLIQPSAPVVLTSDPGGRWGYVGNEYIGIAVGALSTYTTQVGTVTYTHNVGGMISFGHPVPSTKFGAGFLGGGSLLTTTDDGMPLNGNNLYDFGLEGGTVPSGGGVWPLASYWAGGAVEEFDYPSYLSANVDGTVTPIVGGDNANTVTLPEMRDNVLTSVYNVAGSTGNGTGGTGGTGGTTSATGNVQIKQQIQPLRGMAKLTWTITNTDIISHTVSLRWTTHVRGGTQDNSTNTGTTVLYPHGGFYFADPRDGVTFNARLYPRDEPIPAQLAFYGKRYETENAADPPFAARFIFSSDPSNGFAPTAPNQVYVSDSKELYPGSVGTTATALDPAFVEPKFVFGVAVAVYYGSYNLAPGQTQQIVAYYGDGTATQQIDQSTQVGGLSTVVATEATESLQYNTLGANNLPSTAGASFSDLAALFLQPSSFKIYGDLYNLTVKDPQLGVTLPNVKLQLTLPDGLELDPAAGSQTLQQTPQTATTSTESPDPAGTIRPDSDGVVSWTVRPTGTTYGPLTYTMTASATGSLAFTRPVTRVINVPAVPVLQVTSKGFQMIGFPFQFDPTISNNGDPSTVLNGSRFSQAPSDTNVTFYQWVPDPNAAPPYYGSYQIATKIQPGYSYFYRSNVASDTSTGTRTVFLEGALPVANSTPYDSSNPYYDVSKNQIPIDIKQGWNMISIPSLYSVQLGSLQFAPSSNTLTKYSLTDAVNSGLISGGIYFFDSVTQQSDLIADPSANLQPYQGYWIYANQDIQLTYRTTTLHQSAVLPTNDSTAPPTKAVSTKLVGAIASGRAFPTHPNLQNWKLHLVASRGDKSDGTTLFGVAKNGSDGNGKSVTNLPKPPMMSFGPYVSVGLLSTTNDPSGAGANAASRASSAVPANNGMRYAQIMRAASSGTKTWDFEVLADSDGPVTLTWPNLATLPRRLDLQLVDATTGRVVSLRSTSSVVVNVKGGKASRYRIVAAAAPSRPLSISGLHVVHGGGTGKAVGSAYTFAFNVSRAAQVSGRVSTLTGRVLSTFAQGRAATVGQNELSWNGKSTDGTGLPVGTYRAEVTALGDDGQVVKAVQIFVVAR